MVTIPDHLPRLLAEDACAVFWWAFRMRMPRAQQLEEVEKALAKRLSETVLDEPAAAAETAGDYLREPAAAASVQIIREGDAPRETGRFGGVASCPDTEFQIEPDVADPATAGARLDLARAT